MASCAGPRLEEEKVGEEAVRRVSKAVEGKRDKTEKRMNRVLVNPPIRRQVLVNDP